MIGTQVVPMAIFHTSSSILAASSIIINDGLSHLPFASESCDINCISLLISPSNTCIV